MSKNTQCSFTAPKYKLTNAKKSHQMTQNPCEFKDAGLTPNCTSHLLQSTNFPRRQGKFTRQQHGSTRKQKNNSQKNRVVSTRRATVPITPQMIRGAVKELQTRRVYISSALIASHLRRCYPIESNPDTLKKELNEKLNCAVSVGLIVKCGDNKYCIPTLRQQANLNKTALTAFWETYYKNDKPSTLAQLFTSEIPRMSSSKRRASVTRTHSYGSRSDKYEDLDEFEG